MLSFFPRGVLDEILNLIESVSEGFPPYSYAYILYFMSDKEDSDKLLKSRRPVFNIHYIYLSLYLIEKDHISDTTLVGHYE